MIQTALHGTSLVLPMTEGALLFFLDFLGTLSNFMTSRQPTSSFGALRGVE